MFRLTIVTITILFALSISEATFAAPKGAVKLLPSQYFKYSNFYCGYIKKNWISGRLLPGKLFYSRSAEINNLNKQAKTLSGSKKAKLSKKIKALLALKKSESVICKDSKNQVTATATPVVTSPPGSTPSATPTATAVPVSLVKDSDNLYHTEHAIFIIPELGQVNWEGPASWDSVYSPANIDSYVATLKSRFPKDYFFVVITASNLLPDRVPNVLTYRRIADGIGEDSITGVEVPNICRYHSSGPVTEAVFGVLDHEIGHNWGVFIGSELGTGHWLSNSNAEGQMASAYSDDGFQTTKKITGDPLSGFTWTSADNLTRQETETFSERDLYLQGLSSSFPTLHVLENPLYNLDHTVSYNSVASYDQPWVEARNGVRNPSYQNSEKKFKLGFVYIARDLSEITNSYQALERSIRQFTSAEQVDTTKYRFQVPFLYATRFRASADALLVDLDGNSTPTLSVSGAGYVTTINGSASFSLIAGDPDGTSPLISCVPASANCSVSGSTLVLNGLSSGTHFFTVKAEDSGGKKAYAHVVVDAL